MSDIGNKDVFANNLSYYVEQSGKTRGEICEELGIAYSTFSEWINARKYPRIDKIEQLASYFGILKSQLIENTQQPATKPPTPEADNWQALHAVLEQLPDEKLDEVLAYAEYLAEKGKKNTSE